MSKREYTFHIISRDICFTPERLREVLALPALRRILFPARMPVAPGKSVILQGPEDFHPDIIPKEFRDEEEVSLILYTPTDMRFKATVRLQAEDICQFGHLFLLDFRREDAEQGPLNVPVLKQLILEIAPLVRGTYISVFHNYHEPIPHPDGSVTSRLPRMLCNVPLELEWFTYYAPRDLAVIGRERFGHLRTCYEKVEFMGGILVILQEAPMDKRNPEHIRRRKQAEKELGLDQLPATSGG